MKTNKIVLLLVAAVALVGTGCKKFLDVNTDPNHVLTANESLLLSPIEITDGTEITGGFYGTTSAYWMQQISLNQPAPDVESYSIQPVDGDNTWSSYLYPNVFENLNTMIKEAEAAGHHQYAAIGKILFAYNLAITTNLWGDVPYSQALSLPAISAPKYDSQESIYGGIQNLLDSGIYYINQPADVIAPGADDVIYGGNMTAWLKFAYTLKARYYLQLTKAPGRTAATQADSALTALASGFTSNGDNAAVVYYSQKAQAESPWYENTLPGAGGVVLGKSFVDTLIARNDPRLPIIADTGSTGLYQGRPAGATFAPDYTVFSSVNVFYGGYLPSDVNNGLGKQAPLYLSTYSEALFIQAEAIFLTQGATAAKPIYDSAIAAHMEMLGVSNTAINAYLASRPALITSNAIQQIINEKFVADFLNPITYDDWRRTGFPALALSQNAYSPYIPRRWPYTSSEILANPQPQQQGVTTASRVWWDTQ